MDNKPYYLIGDVDIHNMEEYKIYMQNTKPIVEKYSGEYLVRGGTMDAKDTQLWKPTRMVLIKFPNKPSADEFYQSEEYKPFKEMRHKNASSTMIFVESF